MRRIINVVTLAVIIASASVIGWQFRPRSAASPVLIDRFEVGQKKEIHFRFAPESIESLSDDALDEQLLDWLLYAVLAESTLDADGVRDAMYDLPPTRAQYVQPIAAFDFGPVRFRIVDDAGSVVALIPEGSPRRTDLIAQIADAVRTRLGVPPSVMRVFEYRVDPVQLSAGLIRAPDIAGDELYTPAYGYVEKEVRSAADLEAFLNETGDLVSVIPVDGGLKLAGRPAPHQGGRKLTLNDLAALWQSEAVLSHDQKLVDQLNAKWENDAYVNTLAEEMFQTERSALLGRFPELSSSTSNPFQSPSADGGGNDELQRILEELRRTNPALSNLPPYGRWSGGVNGQPRADQALREFEARWKDPTHAHAKKLLRARHQQELDALKSRFQLKGAERVPDGSGFSLDPAYDYTKLRNVFAFHRAELSRRVSAEELSAIDQELLQRREGKLLDTLFRLAQRPADAEFVREVQGDLRLASFQHARYDGTLKGTEVGMVLFYTDLIAKLWAMDFERSAPDGTSGPAHVRGFIPLLKLSPSPIYDKESDERSSTRLWFGPRDGAFAKAADKLLFARIATRVYAASSNSLQPGKEAEANAGSASFLGWWNDHYAQIADFEPEYHRLNQIMKWSAALAWLSSAEQLQSLVFLGQDKVQVHRSHWFPRWARANSRLKFRAWESIEFMPAGFGGIDTEAMEILRSRPYLTRGGVYSLSGGVSLASRGNLAARPSLIETAPRIRRANIAEVSWSDQGHTVKSFDKVAYTLRTAAPRQPASVQATSATKLRGLDLEVRQGAFELRFERHSEGLRARVGVNERSIGELTVSRRGADAIEIQFDPLEMEHARVYSKTLDRASTNGDHGASALAARADVKRVIDYDGTYYVEPVSSSQQWLKITPEGRPSVDLAAGADFRFARLSPAFEKGGERWNVSFVDRARVESDLAQVRFVVQEPSPSPTSGVAFSVSSRGPPNRAGQVIDLHLRPAGERRVLTAIDSGSGGSGKGGRTNGGGGLFDDAAGGSRRLAREAARDPEGTVALLAEARAKHLEHAKALLQEGRFQEARLELDRLAAFLPNDIDVAAQRVIAHAASGSRIAAAEAARLPIDAKRLASFLDMADRAGARLSVHSAEHQQLSTIVRGVVARAHGHEARFISQQGELGIELRLADAKWTSSSTATASGGPRYSLASLDAPPVVDAGPAPHFTPPITAKLRDPLVRAIEPEVLVDTKTGARYQKWTATSTNSAARQSFRTAYGSPGNGCGAGGSGQAPGSDDCKDTIYVTEPASANASIR